MGSVLLDRDLPVAGLRTSTGAKASPGLKEGIYLEGRSVGEACIFSQGFPVVCAATTIPHF